MAINPIDAGYGIQNPKDVNKKMNASEEKYSQDVTDKINLSPEAMKLHETQTQNKLTEIRGKIQSGFYNSDDVLSSVANALVKVIRGK